ncbi:MAG: energy transducer TonB [Candidatus Acidiferrum sp.]
MAPIAKENDLLTATPESASRPSASAPVPSDNAVKQQPVALEVPVSVNGARTVEGSAKREPFSEATKTVLIFGSGAVIRLASSVAPGQLLFLTNEKTKKEVVCQVVKSKNYRNISGYVELEFTESVVGFWGMRFPGDRIGAPSQSSLTPSPAVGSPIAGGAPVAPRPVAPVLVPPPANGTRKIFESVPAVPAVVARDVEPRLSESKIVTPPASVIEIPAAPKPEAPVSLVPATPASLMPELQVDAVPLKPAGPISSTFDLPRTPEAHASIFAPSAQASAAPPIVDVKSLSDEPEPSFVEPPPPDPLAPLAAADPQTAELKQQTARLQEQLSSLLFAEKTAEKHASAPPPPPAPVVDSVKPYDPFAEFSQFAAKMEPAPAPVKRAEPAKIVSPPVSSMLDDEELKIPSWLEPLARNAAAPSSTQEPIERETTKHLAEQSAFEEIAPETTADLEDRRTPELQAPNFGSELNFELTEPSVESSSRKSGKGLKFAAIAAGALLLAGGGVWYFRQQSGDVQAGVTAPSTPSSAVSAPAETLPTQNSSVIPANPPAQGVQSSSSTQNNAPLQTNSGASKAESTGVSLSPISGKPVNSNSAGRGNMMTLAASEPVPAQPKKPSLGQVHLATPKVTKRRSTANDGESDAGLAFSGDESDSNAGALGAGLAANTSQPVAPAVALPVGGDVKQARLISSVPPSYPVLAKNQHVAGDVRVDALIDASGRVTTMKVVSGPTLLHQAAMDALRQWKYQPATLNGNAVPMHLTVTIQFRLQ